MKFDLHMHSNFSDGKASVREILKIAKKLGTGIAITDHNELRGSIMASKIAKRMNIPYFIGVELGTKEGKEMLLYFRDAALAREFYENEIKPFKTTRMTRISRAMSEFVGENGKNLKAKYGIFLSVIPHPFAMLYKNIFSDKTLGEKMLEFCDGIECINASQSKKSNAMAMILCKERGKLPFASTDAHLPENIAKLSTNLEFLSGGGKIYSMDNEFDFYKEFESVNFKITKSDISYNNYHDSIYSIAKMIYQISKKNFYHSFIKKQ
ncbi:MAG: PHP domain-containing protein [Campylobacter sp.]|nr:PHP domain-containing protein [Campylobacter sp.]